MAKLIVCADDYALSPAVDAAVLALIERGVLTATSCMTMSPHWNTSAQALTSALRAKADIGLHLDFTEFSNGLRFSHPQLVLRALLRVLNPAALQANIALQIDAFEQAMGTAPDYIDGHLHVHQLPLIREALCAELSRRYGHLPFAQRPWLRVSSPPAGTGIKARIIHYLGARALQALAQQHGFQYSPCLLGVYDFSGDVATYQAHWHTWHQQLMQCSAQHAAQLPPVLMCHPAQAAEAHTSPDPIAAARVVEWQLLSSDAFRAWMQQSKLVPVKGRVCNA